MSKTFDLIFVDDEAKACDLFVRFCRGKPYRAHTFQDAREALKHFRNHGADLIITDLRMPGMDGIELLAQIRDEDRDVPAIVITAYSTVNAAINALRLGAVDFLKSPSTWKNSWHWLIEHSIIPAWNMKSVCCGDNSRMSAASRS